MKTCGMNQLAKLRSRGALCLSDRQMNEPLFVTGGKYVDLFFASQSTLASRGIPHNSRVSAQYRPSLPGSIEALSEFRAARKSMLVREWQVVVDRIILFDEDPAQVGREVSGRAQAQQAFAIAVDRLQSGLLRLAVHFKLLDKTQLEGDAPLDHVSIRAWSAPSELSQTA